MEHQSLFINLFVFATSIHNIFSLSSEPPSPEIAADRCPYGSKHKDEYIFGGSEAFCFCWKRDQDMPGHIQWTDAEGNILTKSAPGDRGVALDIDTSFFAAKAQLTYYCRGVAEDGTVGRESVTFSPKISFGPTQCSVDVRRMDTTPSTPFALCRSGPSDYRRPIDIQCIARSAFVDSAPNMWVEFKNINIGTVRPGSRVLPLKREYMYSTTFSYRSLDSGTLDVTCRVSNQHFSDQLTAEAVMEIPVIEIPNDPAVFIINGARYDSSAEVVVDGKEDTTISCSISSPLYSSWTKYVLYCNDSLLQPNSMTSPGEQVSLTIPAGSWTSKRCTCFGSHASGCTSQKAMIRLIVIPSKVRTITPVASPVLTVAYGMAGGAAAVFVIMLIVIILVVCIIRRVRSGRDARTRVGNSSHQEDHYHNLYNGQTEESTTTGHYERIQITSFTSQSETVPKAIRGDNEDAEFNTTDQDDFQNDPHVTSPKLPADSSVSNGDCEARFRAVSNIYTKQEAMPSPSDIHSDKSENCDGISDEGSEIIELQTSRKAA